MEKKNIKNDFWFIFLLILFYLFYGYSHSIRMGSYALHQWRQADCLSITANYYENNLSFFEPEINWCGSEGKRKVVSEFPILYYFVANLWKIFGKQEMIFRLINLIIFSSGLFALYKAFQQYLKDNFWAIVLTSFLFTSPLLGYYANNFLMNAPALGLVLIALYFLTRYYLSLHTKFFYISSAFFLLAGLLKITALLSFIGLVPVHIYFVLSNNKIRNKIISIVPIAIVFLIIFAWYYYAKQYNEANLKGIFLQGILPVWELKLQQIKDISVILYHDLLPNFLSKSALFVLLSIFVYTVFHFKKANKFLLVLTINCYIGCFLYLVFFFQVFNVHDYYLTNLLIIVPLTFATFFDLLKKIHPDILKDKGLKLTTIIVLGALIYNSAVLTRLKYNSNDRLVRYSFIIDKKTQDHWNWYHWNYNNTFRALESIEPYLRELGIQRNDKVISIPDQSINISLTLMNQIGFTDFGYNDLIGQDRIKRFIEMGAEYLIINDKSHYDNEFLKPFITKKIGSYRNIDVYSLKKW